MMFYQSYATVKSTYKNLPNAINDLREQVAHDAKEEYLEPSIEVESIEKVGFRKYFVILRVTGRVVEV